MATDEDYPIDLPILVIEAQIFVAVKKFPFLPNKLIPSNNVCTLHQTQGSTRARWPEGSWVQPLNWVRGSIYHVVNQNV